MSDALCGPSNALQSFQKHTQVDRTIQQDRLVGLRQSPGQQFRSHDPRTGSLDAEFSAFENAHHEPFIYREVNPQKSFHNDIARSRPVDAWASDFQQMRISTQPISAANFRAEAPLVRSAPGGWQQEFMRQRQNGTSHLALGKQPMYQQAHTETITQPTLSIYGGLQPQYSHMSAQHHGEMQPVEQAGVSQNIEHLSVADWSEAFNEATKAASNAEHTTLQHEEQILHLDGTYTNDRSQMVEGSVIHEREDVRIGSDAIDYKEMQDRTADQNAQDASALARVAGELLHNVQHETNDKFQNSQFLQLMRKIRDRQVEIRNNEFEPTQGQSITPSQEAQSSAVGPDQQSSDFTFPNMDTVYAPNPADAVDYSFDSDQFPTHQGPRSQIQELHPGGRLYPGTPEHQPASMSGGVRPLSGSLGDRFNIGEGAADGFQDPALQERSTMA